MQTKARGIRDRMTESRLDILACGGVTLDTIYRVSRIPPVHFEAEIESVTDAFGGRAPNVAYMGARLGIRTGVLSPVGADFESSGYRSRLEEAGVGLRGAVKIRFAPTTHIYIFDDGAGNTLSFFHLGASSEFER